jgi:soluble lytic murein transglycosylase-like protein
LNAQLHFSLGLLIVTDHRVLFASQDGCSNPAWSRWTLVAGMKLTHTDHAGVGTLSLVDETHRLASWRFTLSHNITAMRLQDLPKPQAAVAEWLARKYKVAPEPLAALVAESYALSKKTKLAPHFILAVIAIESNFHPYVQSQAGAQGLMQVVTEIHAKRYEAYGGRLAAFDPVANVRVGVAVLADAVKMRGGSQEEGLKFYLGGYALKDDGGYVAKVLAEQAQLDGVAAGQKSVLP